MKKPIAFMLTMSLAGCESGLYSMPGTSGTVRHYDNANIAALDCRKAIKSAQNTGMVAGAVIGAAIARDRSKGKSSKEKNVNTALAAALGAALGNQIGGMIGERDQACIQQITLTALNNNKTQRYENKASGVTAQVEVKGSYTKKEKVHIPKEILKDSPAQIPPIELAPGHYAATTNVNVRVGPGTQYKMSGSLASHQEVEVLGKVEGENWYILGASAPVKGYVSSPLLTLKKASSYGTPNAPGAGTVAVEVSRECRQLSTTVYTQDGQTRQVDQTACKGPNGWEVA